MKKSIYILNSILIILFLFSACKPKVDIQKEQGAIIAVIEEERNAYFDRDISRLEAIWVQDSTSKRIFRSETALIILKGWTGINANYQEDFEADVWKDYEDLMADFSNWEINIYNNSALVYHDIHWTGKYFGEEVEAEQKRVVHLVKSDGTWKINFIAQITIPSQNQDMEELSDAEER
jgi:hypothetical protein